MRIIKTIALLLLAGQTWAATKHRQQGFEAITFPSSVTILGPLSAGGGVSGPVAPGSVDFSTITAQLNTKLSSGPVPNQFIDLSTVTTALNGKANTFVGITSSCPSGYYLNSGTWDNGVTTGGSCAADVSGGGGGGDSSWTTVGAVVKLTTATNNVVAQATMTVQGQDANGFSLSVSSGISAQCITLQGGQVCGPGVAGLSQAQADLLYVNVNGDTMTGELVVNNSPGTSIVTSSNIVTTNGGFLGNFVKTSTAQFTATGDSQFSVRSSSGIEVATGRVLLGAGSYIEWPNGQKSTSPYSGLLLPSGGGSSVLVKVASASYTALASGTNTVPLDDTIPQCTSSEGDQYMSQTFTPASATNILQIQAQWCGANSDAARVIVFLCQDSTADALAVAPIFGDTSTGSCSALTYWMTAGTTGATTFKIRAGAPIAGTTRFNGSGTSGARLWGGRSASTLSIKEYTP